MSQGVQFGNYTLWLICMNEYPTTWLDGVIGEDERVGIRRRPGGAGLGVSAKEREDRKKMGASGRLVGRGR